MHAVLLHLSASLGLRIVSVLIRSMNVTQNTIISLVLCSWAGSINCIREPEVSSSTSTDAQVDYDRIRSIMRLRAIRRVVTVYL